jgi:TM2 domain-containing membrane protein YozV
MNCFYHPEVPAAAYCRTCGKALCEGCRKPGQGTVFCEEHVPATAAAPAPDSAPAAEPPPSAVPPAASPAYDTSPGIAAFLGFIPGVGAIYNGQYAKGLVHAVIFGLTISIASSLESEGINAAPFIMLAIAFYVYMIVEAYHTARKRRAGEPVDEFSSLMNLRPGATGFPAGAVTLIVLGVILLLNTLEIVRFRYLVRYWPAALIVIGFYMLYNRMSAASEGDRQEVRNGR